MKKIKLLDEQVINQIAAGEVVERPASVVKELVENSIDAGATKVQVEISQGGRGLRIADNGSGIDKEDVELAFSRHATSKISDEKDLWKLNSFGFRGEALASILSVSKVFCITKTKDAEHGIKVVNNNGKLEITDVGCAVGTTIEIKDLFYNVPARLKFMKQPKSEVTAIIETLQNIAISHPEIALIAKSQEKVVLKTTGSGDLSICLSELFSKDLLDHLLLINALDENKNYFVNGVVTEPAFTKSNRKSIYTIVNGRFVKCHVIAKAVERAFQDMVPSGRFPMAVVNLIMPTSELDVNVHPSKKEVKYASTNEIFSFVNFSIRKALEDGNFYVSKTPVTETIIKDNFKDNSNINNSKKDSQESLQDNRSHIEEKKVPIQEPKKESHSVSTRNHLEKKTFSESITQKAVDVYKPIEEAITPKSNQPEQEIHVVTVQPKEETTEQLPLSSDIKTGFKEVIIPKKVIGQVFNTYVVIETSEGLQLVDQHIASERAIYDKIKKQDREIAGQRLFIIEEIDANLSQVYALEDNKEELSRWGFLFDIVETNKVLLKQIPYILSGKNPIEVFDEIISLIDRAGSIDSLEDDILKTISCHAAVRAGDKLSISQMEKLIKEWEETDFPYTCPHGRKIAHTIKKNELASFFGRPQNVRG